MTNLTKRRALAFLVLIVILTILLAAALPQLKLQKGIPLPGSAVDMGTGEVTEEPRISITVSTFFKVVLSVLLIILLIYFAFRLRLKPDWKEVAQSILIAVVLALFFTALFFAFAQIQVNVGPVEFEVLPTEVKQVGAPLEPMPPYLLCLVWTGLAAVLVLFVIVILRSQKQSRAAADPLVFEAEQAVQAIKAGQDLRSVIIHCYRQMSQILQKEQGIALVETMTAREFEVLLKTRGIPEPPVHQLTRLFEMARYGVYLPGPEAESQAMDSLTAIIQFSQKKEAGLSK